MSLYRRLIIPAVTGPDDRYCRSELLRALRSGRSRAGRSHSARPAVTGSQSPQGRRMRSMTLKYAESAAPSRRSRRIERRRPGVRPSRICLGLEFVPARIGGLRGCPTASSGYPRKGPGESLGQEGGSPCSLLRQLHARRDSASGGTATRSTLPRAKRAKHSIVTSGRIPTITGCTL